MAFPTTGILDAFNRANESPLAGNWSNKINPSDKAPDLISNALIGTAAGWWTAWWNAATFGPDVEVWATINAAPDVEATVYARIQNPGGTTTLHNYQLDISFPSTWTCYRNDSNSTYVSLGTVTQPVSAGDGYGMSVIGSTITFWYKPSGGLWAPIATFTDATYSSAGYIGAGAYGTSQGIDDFGGGTVVITPPTPPQESRVYAWNALITVNGRVYAQDPINDYGAAFPPLVSSNGRVYAYQSGLKTVDGRVYSWRDLIVS